MALQLKTQRWWIGVGVVGLVVFGSLGVYIWRHYISVTAQVAPDVTHVERAVLAASTTTPPGGSSYGPATSYHMPWEKYPVGEREQIGGTPERISNWPTAGDGGSDCRVNANATTVVDGIGGTFNYGGFMMMPLPMSGNRTAGQDKCSGSVSAWTAPDGENSTSSATPAPSWFDDVVAANSGGLAGGAYVNPRAYGGWATDANTTTKVPFGVPTQRSGAAGAAEFAECGGVAKESGTSAWATDGAFRQSMYDQGGQSKPLWGARCKDETKLKEFLTRRHNAPQTDTNGGNYVKSSGVTLFRQKFRLTSQQLEEIRQLDLLNDGRSGLYLRLAVDDYAAVYVNGKPVFANPKASSGVEMKRIIADYLRAGDNVIALEVQDAIAPTSLANANAAARWLLGVYAPKGWQPVPGEPRLYGSWAEYAISAPGQIISSSGAGLSSTPTGRTGAIEARQYNDLTFQNTNIPFGNFRDKMPTVRTPDAYFTNTGNLSGAVSMSDVAGGVYQAGNLTITGGEIKRGRQIVIKSGGVVTIKGDVKQGGGNYSAARDLPQLIISARHIIIEPNVTQLDAWLVAKNGTINTCDTIVRDSRQWLSGLDAKTCEKQLRINGPIVAKHLFLRRTFTKGGDTSGNNPGEPAEILNLRADAYLWGNEWSKESGAIKTMHLKELPPRF